MSTTRTCLTTAVAERLRQSCTTRLGFHDLIVGARRAISESIVEGFDLDAVWRESDPEKRHAGGYRRHQAVRCPDHGFTVVVLLWEPGACTPIHDHDTWCCFGMLEGELEVVDYEIVADDADRPLIITPRAQGMLRAGTTGDNGAADREIHLVRNVGEERAMSLHVYGADLTIRKPFDGRSIRVAGEASSQDQPVY